MNIVYFYRIELGPFVTFKTTHISSKTENLEHIQSFVKNRGVKTVK